MMIRKGLERVKYVVFEWSYHAEKAKDWEELLKILQCLSETISKLRIKRVIMREKNLIDEFTNVIS